MTRRSQSAPTVSQRISDFIARTRAEHIPAEVRESAKLHLLDGLATMLAGSKEKSAQLLCRHYSVLNRKPQASVLGTKIRLAAEQAALINGVSGHVLDYDDAQMATLAARPMGQQTHPTSPVLAAALALAESRRLSGSTLLASYIVGVEVACRLGDAVDPSHYLDGFYPTGTLGAFGAAAACAHLLKLKPVAIRHALGIAGTLSSGLRANRGTMAKGLNAGRAAENGVLAATLAGNGFTASENIFDDPMGFFSAACRNKVDGKLLRFGKPFFFAEPGIGIKLYPCAGVLHPALDLLLQLRERHALVPVNVQSIRITLDKHAARPLVYDRPENGLESKFSLPFAAAVALIDGAAGLKQFSSVRLRDQKLQNLMNRVRFARRAPRGKHTGIETHVEITSQRGVTLGGRDSVARGHPSRPASRADIEDKFRQCAGEILPPKQIAKFLQNFWALEQTPSTAAWLRSSVRRGVDIAAVEQEYALSPYARGICTMRIVDLSMTVEECDSAPFAPDEKYFKLKPIIKWEDKGFVSNTVQMTVHVGTHIDSPHHFFRDKPSIEQLPLEPMMGKAVVLDLTTKGVARARITTADMVEAEQKLNRQGVEIPEGGMILLRTDWPKGHDTTDPKWWNDSPYLTREAAQWLVDKKPAVVGFDFAQEEKGADYQQADQILDSAMRVHRTILPRVIFQIENLINLDQIGPTAQIVALPVKWKTESAPARVIAILDS